MGTLGSALAQALGLLANPTPELLAIIWRTLNISGGALMLAALFGLPIGAAVALWRFPLRGVLAATLNALMGLPPVVAGLFLYVILSRSGPLGFMGLLYTPSAMVIAQFVLALPLVAALSSSAIKAVDPSIRLAARTLGATPAQATLAVIKEARFGILSALMAAFGRVMAEVGAVLIVGGNIAGYTRVMTTTIALETDKGDFSLALALGLILLLISMAVNMSVHYFQGRAHVERIA
ncbi:MAG: ABC transporter permease [Thermodesulfovibrionales bacterium]|nr:ABC transporter permease [Thermodesulfovibrionales bacterium]